MENYSESQLRQELKRREDIKLLEKIKRALINLKVIPHLKQAIEKYENDILAANDLRFINQLFELRNFSLLHRNSCSIYYQLQHFIEGNKVNWINSDKIVFNKCSMCENYEILQYLENKLLQVDFSLKDGFGTEYQTTFVDSS